MIVTVSRTPFASEIKLPVDPPRGSVPPAGGKSLLTCGFKYRSPDSGLVDDGKYSARAAPVGSGAVAHWKPPGAWIDDLDRPSPRGR